MREQALNVYGKPLKSCCSDPMTGFYRDGYCHTGAMDHGTHVVCAVMTADFLSYTKTRGNDLSTPIPAYNFPGLLPGDKWCLCVLRWLESIKAGAAPPLILDSINLKALEYAPLETYEQYAYPADRVGNVSDEMDES